jgi:UDP-glucose 4-epimerase
VIGTFNVLDAMRQTGIKPIIFSSTGAVYGELCHEVATSESAGPLLPVSTYAAGKISSEAFIAAFCSLYGLRGWVFRFGNVIGARMTHGVIFDFIKKLRENPDELLIRGDGRQEKNYFLVEECIDGMAYAYRNIPMTEDKPCDVFNLGTDFVSKVVDIAQIVKEEMGLPDARVVIEGTKRAWPGDQPKVHITVDRMHQFGWRAKLTSDTAVRIAVRRMLGKE